MNLDNAVEIEGVCKDFRVYSRTYGTLKSQTAHLLQRMLHSDQRQEYTIRHALTDVTFEVPRGQSVALLGHNGSGKSTLLSLLTRIYLPTAGEIRIRGRVASLLELGYGFNLELTGIENVFFTGTICGLSKTEIAERYPKIIEFAELDEKALALPVRMYSSGMGGRLAFAIAIYMNSDILLIDEGLAVGDLAFQEKSLQKLLELKGLGKTIFFVTHHHDFVDRFAERAIWLDQGAVFRDGPTAEVAAEYRVAMLG